MPTLWLRSVGTLIVKCRHFGREVWALQPWSVGTSEVGSKGYESSPRMVAEEGMRQTHVIQRGFGSFFFGCLICCLCMEPLALLLQGAFFRVSGNEFVRLWDVNRE